jgi:excisionase family DNA binding protein
MPKQKLDTKRPATPELLKGRIMIRAQEYADLTGTPLPTVYKYLSGGEIPAIRIGSSVRIPVSAVAEQMAQADRTRA